MPGPAKVKWIEKLLRREFDADVDWSAGSGDHGMVIDGHSGHRITTIDRGRELSGASVRALGRRLEAFRGEDGLAKRFADAVYKVRRPEQVDERDDDRPAETGEHVVDVDGATGTDDR